MSHRKSTPNFKKIKTTACKNIQRTNHQPIFSCQSSKNKDAFLLPSVTF
nr:MAG TPA: hypothetical protein [Caudoviricetes sp.]